MVLQQLHDVHIYFVYSVSYLHVVVRECHEQGDELVPLDPTGTVAVLCSEFGLRKVQGVARNKHTHR